MTDRIFLDAISYLVKLLSEEIEEIDEENDNNKTGRLTGLCKALSYLTEHCPSDAYSSTGTEYDSSKNIEIEENKT